MLKRFQVQSESVCHGVTKVILSTPPRMHLPTHKRFQFQSESVCQSGFEELPEMHWKLDQEAAEREAMEQCAAIKHTFVRISRECLTVDFITHLVRLVGTMLCLCGIWDVDRSVVYGRREKQL